LLNRVELDSTLNQTGVANINDFDDDYDYLDDEENSNNQYMNHNNNDDLNTNETKNKMVKFGNTSFINESSLESLERTLSPTFKPRRFNINYLNQQKEEEEDNYEDDKFEDDEEDEELSKLREEEEDEEDDESSLSPISPKGRNIFLEKRREKRRLRHQRNRNNSSVNSFDSLSFDSVSLDSSSRSSATPSSNFDNKKEFTKVERFKLERLDEKHESLNSNSTSSDDKKITKKGEEEEFGEIEYLGRESPSNRFDQSIDANLRSSVGGAKSISSRQSFNYNMDSFIDEKDEEAEENNDKSLSDYYLNK
jgi:hypothetical protein